jgi:hypothetical protein
MRKIVKEIVVLSAASVLALTIFELVIKPAISRPALQPAQK